jgi:hypothetical protein
LGDTDDADVRIGRRDRLEGAKAFGRVYYPRLGSKAQMAEVLSTTLKTTESQCYWEEYCTLIPKIKAMPRLP